MKNKYKGLKSKWKNKTEAITDQNERLADLTNKDDIKDNYEKIYEELKTLGKKELRMLTKKEFIK